VTLNFFTFCKSYSLPKRNFMKIRWCISQLRTDISRSRDGAILIGPPKFCESSPERRVYIRKIREKSDNHKRVILKWMLRKHSMIIWRKSRPMWNWGQFNVCFSDDFREWIFRCHQQEGIDDVSLIFSTKILRYENEQVSSDNNACDLYSEINNLISWQWLILVSRNPAMHTSQKHIP
jgi:hypothetical protein